MNHDKIFNTVTANGMREMTLERFREAIGMLWTSPCDCPTDEKTGEMLCCNHCGKPTARTESKELPGDEEIENDGYRGGLRDGELQVYWEGAVWLRSIASPLLASKDARIRELEEENHRMNLLNKQYSAFRKEVMLINSEKLEEIDAKYFPF